MHAAVGPIALAGSADLGFQARSDDFAGGLALDLTGSIADLQTPFAEADALLGEAVTFKTSLTQSEDGLAVESLEVKGGHAELDAKGDLNEGFSRVAADYDLSLSDLSVLAPSLGLAIAGQLTGNGRIEGDVTAPQVAGTAALRDATLADVSLSKLDLDYRLTDLTTAPQGTLAVTGQSTYGAIAANGAFLYDQERLRLDPLHVQARSANIHADGPLDIDLASGLVSGKLRGQSEDLGKLSDLAGGWLAGRATATAELAAKAGAQGTTLSAQTEGFGFDDLRIGKADLSLESDDLLGDFSGSASLTATDLAYGDQKLDRNTPQRRNENGAGSPWRTANPWNELFDDKFIVFLFFPMNNRPVVI